MGAAGPGLALGTLGGTIYSYLAITNCTKQYPEIRGKIEGDGQAGSYTNTLERGLAHHSPSLLLLLLLPAAAGLRP